MTLEIEREKRENGKSGKKSRQNYTLVEQKAILLILISIIDKNINFSSK